MDGTCFQFTEVPYILLPWIILLIAVLFIASVDIGTWEIKLHKCLL